MFAGSLGILKVIEAVALWEIRQVGVCLCALFWTTLTFTGLNCRPEGNYIMSLLEIIVSNQIIQCVTSRPFISKTGTSFQDAELRFSTFSIFLLPNVSETYKDRFYINRCLSTARSLRGILCNRMNYSRKIQRNLIAQIILLCYCTVLLTQLTCCSVIQWTLCYNSSAVKKM